ncbi:hypothetical protein TSOC_000919 [Tetrabaena socialis]|nr:hypothetical protein TSOC_000919 [Tetrabaena socialis]|eukprot:PNH12144.1 hypothetical protein TSOC_000919 [Tetrabaena socialis]
MLIVAMRHAGVVNARSCLDFLKRSKKMAELSNTEAWKLLLADNPELVACLIKRIPSWARNTGGKQTVPSVLASKIASLHGSPKNDIHSFDSPLGLTIWAGMPDEVTTLALTCIAEHFNVPHTVVVRSSLLHVMLSLGARWDEAGEVGGAGPTI